MSFVVVEDHTKKYIHQEEDSEQNENHKIKGVPCARIIGIEHHVWVV